MKPRFPKLTIIESCEDDALFGRWFRKPATWRAWFTFLRVLFGLPMGEADMTTFRKCTERDRPPAAGITEAWLICGRRAGKSFILALIAVFLAVFVDWSDSLSPGERGTIMIIAADRKQARTIFRFVAALLKTTILNELVERETQDAIDLVNNVTIEVSTASFRTVRGYTLIAALLDEIAFFPSDENGANPDKEIVAAIRPAMATVPGAILLAASSPYARRGELWTTYRRHHGKPDSPVLTWKADTKTMNPTVPDRVIAEAYENDPSAAASEFGAQFRVDVEGFVAREAVEACVASGLRERAPVSGTRYVAFVDPSGGSADSMTLAIAHRDARGSGILDCLRERKPPFSPESVVSEFAETLKSYNVHTIVGDRYAGEWPRERFQVHGIRYETSEKAKSDIYQSFLPLLNSGKVELLDHSRLVAQLCGLERRTARSGRDSIDHGPGGHDDLANAMAGVIVLATAHAPMVITRAMVNAVRMHPPARGSAAAALRRF